MTPSQPNPDRSPASSDAPVPPAPRAALDRSLELVRFLRAHCEWDAAQTPHSLLPYLLEESHEVADAVAAGDDTELAGELGDLLLNVAFQVVLAEERRAFTADDVADALEAKMRRRHPHLYGDGPRQDWDTLKAAEQRPRAEPPSLLHGMAAGLEPLARAQRIQERVATVGFDWPDHRGALEKVQEEVEEVKELLQAPGTAPAERLEEELGDLLFAVVNLARLTGQQATTALRRANAKFTSRFQSLETLAAHRNVTLGEATLEELDQLWDEIKNTPT